MQLIAASKKRLLLALYIDSVLFGALWALGVHFLEPLGRYWFLEYVAFVVFETALLHWFGSPGRYALSIFSVARPEWQSAGIKNGVDSRIWTSENWLTILLGVLFILDGAKSMVRWTAWNPPLPLLSHEVSASVNILVGTLWMLAGVLVLRLRVSGVWLAITLGISELAFIGTTWRAWDGYAREMTTRRAAFLGQPVDPARIEFAQALIPEILVATIVLELAALGFLLWKFRAAGAEQAEIVV